VLLISASNKPRKSSNFTGVADTGNASLIRINDTGNACIAGVVDTGDAPLGHLTIR
jgi:hypothetical protein